MMKQQSGFTLIELIMVIVVLAALAVSAIPRYVDLQTEADQAAVDGIAGALAAGSAINYAACVAGDPACLSGVNMNNCNQVAVTIAGGAVGVPAADYTADAAAFAGVAGDAEACTVTHTPSGLSSGYSAINPG